MSEIKIKLDQCKNILTNVKEIELKQTTWVIHAKKMARNKKSWSTSKKKMTNTKVFMTNTTSEKLMIRLKKILTHASHSVHIEIRTTQRTNPRNSRFCGFFWKFIDWKINQFHVKKHTYRRYYILKWKSLNV